MKEIESVFLTKQRAFLKLYLIQLLRKGRGYGSQLQDDLEAKFAEFNYRPTQTEVYRSLQDLLEEGILKRWKEKKGKYAEVAVYEIIDYEKASAYQRLVRKDIDRSNQLLLRALKDTEKA